MSGLPALRITPMARAAIFAQLVLCAAGCNRLDQSRATSTASRLESRHLGEVRRMADDLESSCTPRSPLDADPAVAEVEVSCGLGKRTRVRGTTWTLSDGYFAIGVGKNAEAGVNADLSAEETVKVPSTIAPHANDLCIHRRQVDICVAYRD
jgi:hypothetical protein